MKPLGLISILILMSCLVLCTCSPGGVGEGIPPPPDVLIVDPPPPDIPIVDPELSILDCPPEDVAEYPNLEVDESIPPPPPDSLKLGGGGWCNTPPNLSVKMLSFGAQGGIRCIATSGFMAVDAGAPLLGCFEERNGTNSFKREVCPWFTLTKIDERTLHVSVKRNETKNERNIVRTVRQGNCHNPFTITQSAD